MEENPRYDREESIRILNMTPLDNIVKDFSTVVEKEVDPTSLSIFVGKLTTYALETAEFLGWLEEIPERYFDAKRFARDLINQEEVYKLYGDPNDIEDEDGVWILNPDDFADI